MLIDIPNGRESKQTIPYGLSNELEPTLAFKRPVILGWIPPFGRSPSSSALPAPNVLASISISISHITGASISTPYSAARFNSTSPSSDVPYRERAEMSPLCLATLLIDDE